jgi:flagellar hook-associated protein 3 FlgL
VRISNLSIARSYRSNLNNAQAKLNEASLRAQTGMRMNAMHEDVARGLRAFKVRRDLARNATYLDNVKEVQSYYTAAEDYVNGIAETAKTTSALYVSALNEGVNNSEEYKAFHAQISRVQEELLTDLNAKFTDRYLFGGTMSERPPFAKDADGDLAYTYIQSNGLYNTVKVKDLSPENPDHAEIFSDPSFLDVGLDMTLMDGEMIPSTVYDRALNGLTIIGYGEDNLYDNMTKILKTLEAEDPDPALLDRINSNHATVTLTLTRLGADSNYLTFTADRLANDKINLETRRTSLEGVELEEAATEWKLQQYLYDAALQMGTRLLQPSLFSFLS